MPLPFPTMLAPGLYELRLAGIGPVYAETATGCIIAARFIEASERFYLTAPQSAATPEATHAPAKALP